MLQIGDQFDHFQIRDHIAQGGMSDIYRAFDLLNGKEVVSLGVRKRSGENLLRIAAEVKQIVEDERKVVPAGVDLAISNDQSRFITRMVEELGLTQQLLETEVFSGHVDSWHYGAMDNGTANATMLEVARLLAQHRDELYRGLRVIFWSGHSHGRYSGSTWYVDNHWEELHDRCVAHVNVDSTGARGAS